MGRMLRAELARLRSRRLTWVALGLVALALVLFQLVTFYSVRPLTSAERADAQTQYQQAQQEYEQDKTQYQAEEKQCLAEGNPPEACRNSGPELEQFARSIPTVAETADIAVTLTVVLSGLALLFLGASFIGAEYSSGAIGNWLSFLPERGKVYASKLLALAAAAAVVTAVAGALTLALTALVSSSVGATVTGLGPEAERAARGVAIGVVCAVLGFALAMLTRHTIAAAGTVLGYLFLSFVLSAVGLAVPSLQKVKPYQPENNLLAFLDHGYTYQDIVQEMTPDGMSGTSVPHTITFEHSLVYWLVVLAVVVGVTWAVFRRRDVA